jgi:hypothetical protein
MTVARYDYGRTPDIGPDEGWVAVARAALRPVAVARAALRPVAVARAALRPVAIARPRASRVSSGVPVARPGLST